MDFSFTLLLIDILYLAVVIAIGFMACGYIFTVIANSCEALDLLLLKLLLPIFKIARTLPILLLRSLQAVTVPLHLIAVHLLGSHLWIASSAVIGYLQ